ncbi:hypothetical protein M9H77_13923 [Catharanthus roseus]|uniref:Uncharacterized protein n=1 Tax=Catharanthus roseus TaxID=4058 RepID=A0ACC0BLT0_CATRO|nr:hypothetical protein M9H77_13923 [Catharanthus roseus]
MQLADGLLIYLSTFDHPFSLHQDSRDLLSTYIKDFEPESIHYNYEEASNPEAQRWEILEEQGVREAAQALHEREAGRERFHEAKRKAEEEAVATGTTVHDDLALTAIVAEGVSLGRFTEQNHLVYIPSPTMLDFVKTAMGIGTSTFFTACTYCRLPMSHEYFCRYAIGKFINRQKRRRNLVIDEN